jgi:Spy/CpxP family protein refolding chaperone
MTGSARASRLPWVLLALSVALNLAFFAGFAWSRAHHARFAGGPGGGMQRLERAAKELKLDPGQDAAWTEFIQATRQRGRGLGDANGPLIDSAWNELAKPNPDASAVEQAFQQASENRREFQRDTMSAMIRFLATLGPDQRLRFIEHARPPAPWQHGRPGRQRNP